MSASKFPSVTDTLSREVARILGGFGAEPGLYEDGSLTVRSPLTGQTIGRVRETAPGDAKSAIGRAHHAFLAWRAVPAPRRGEFVRQLGEALRAGKDDLGRLVTIEAGKSLSEGLGEVQEMIDICDLAVGLSRQLYA